MANLLDPNKRNVEVGETWKSDDECWKRSLIGDVVHGFLGNQKFWLQIVDRKVHWNLQGTGFSYFLKVHSFHSLVPRFLPRKPRWRQRRARRGNTSGYRSNGKNIQKAMGYCHEGRLYMVSNGKRSKSSN